MGGFPSVRPPGPPKVLHRNRKATAMNSPYDGRRDSGMGGGFTPADDTDLADACASGFGQLPSDPLGEHLDDQGSSTGTPHQTPQRFTYPAPGVGGSLGV